MTLFVWLSSTVVLVLLLSLNTKHCELCGHRVSKLSKLAQCGKRQREQLAAMYVFPEGDCKQF